ncbi:MAG TPA: sigma-70 family RNA polymerase sigma factor [Anaerolineales bacterium]|nr:sigma-70 family RNA polymerase sigma factor [Anaerolineales bacterium]
MTPAKLYELARAAVVGMAVSGYDREDLLQEAVLKGWCLVREGKAFGPSYVRSAMRRHILSIARKTARRKPMLPLETEPAAPFSEPLLVTLPKGDGRMRAVVVAVVRNGCDIGAAARELGWPYSTTYWAWAAARARLSAVLRDAS